MGSSMGSGSTVTISKYQPESSDEKENKRGVAIPTATEVTISRLAAPTTTDRTLQHSCLSRLRTFFESFKRIVREGDVIALPIDTLMAQTLASVSGEEDLMGVLPPGKPNDVAWFKITSVSGPSLAKKEADTNTKSEEEEAVTSSETEFLIDPSVTRMVQSGLVTQKVPSTSLGWRHYLALDDIPDFGLADKGSDFEHAKKLKQIVTASISLRGVALQTTILVHSSKRGTGKSTMVRSVAGQMGIHCFDLDCYNLIGESDAKTIGALRARLDRACQIFPCIILLRHIDAIAKKSEQDGGDTGIVANLIEVLADYSDKKCFIIAATVSDIDKMSEAIRSKFKFEVVVPVPTESERRKVFSHLCRKPLKNNRLTKTKNSSVPFAFTPRSDVSLDNLALQSAGLTPPDLESIMEIAKVRALSRLNKFISDAANHESETSNSTNRSITEADLILGYGGLVKLTPDDIEESISEARTKYSDSIGAPRIPNVGWEDVGGLDGVKKEILDTIEMPLKYPQLFSGGMKKRSGILFYGPPGTGKTLLAKAIATSFSLNFFSVKGPELLNMYIGESEANVRKVFQKARDAKPCVVFFDELDSVAPKRGNQGDSGGVMDRIVSQLLAELDGMSGPGGSGVFVVGATNRPDLLDEALLRPGRFDKMLYLGISDTHEKQKTIIQALTRKFALDDDVDLGQVAEKCPFTYTGADFYALSSDAMLNAMTRTAGDVDEKIKQYNSLRGENPVSTRWWFQNVARPEDTSVKVTVADFDKAQRDLVPSVSAEELQHYLRVRESFEGGKSKEKQADAEDEKPQDGSMTIGEAKAAAAAATANTIKGGTLSGDSNGGIIGTGNGASDDMDEAFLKNGNGMQNGHGSDTLAPKKKKNKGKAKVHS